MDIFDFEEYVESIILERGYNYYINGAVRSLVKSDNRYVAKVDGSILYTVIAELDEDGHVDDLSCNCPYDMGEYCKHEVAVLYALREKYDKGGKAIQRGNENKLPKLLEACTEAELRKIILKKAETDYLFNDYLVMKLSECGDAKQMVGDYQRAVSRAYYDFRDIDNAVAISEGFVEKVEAIFDLPDRLQVLCSVLDVLNKLSEDYYGNEDECPLDYTMTTASALVVEAVDLIIKQYNRADIDAAWKELVKCHLSVGGAESDIYEAMTHFCVYPEYRKRLDELLYANREVASEYETDQIDRRRFELIKAYGTDEEAIDFVNRNIDKLYFRNLAIDYAIKLKDYKRAEKLLLDGEKMDKNYLGRVNEWRKKRFQIYKLSGNNEKLATLCRELVLGGDFEYYAEWKRSIPEDSQRAEIESLLSENNNKSYEKIIVDENMIDKIYILCGKIPQRITEYFIKLKDTDFEEPARQIYESYIRQVTDKAQNRSDYARVSHLLNAFGKVCSEENARAIAEDLKKLYCRRPAFLDELKKARY